VLHLALARYFDGPLLKVRFSLRLREYYIVVVVVIVVAAAAAATTAACWNSGPSE